MRFLLVILACVLLQACASGVQSRQLEQSKQYFTDGDYKQSFHKLLPLATEGNSRAQYALGYLYYYGYGVMQDTETGLFWMQKAADQHYAPAVQALKMIKERG